MSQQKVLVLVGDAAEELDAMYPIYRLREAGYIADVAALTRREVQLVIHDFDPNSDAYTEKNGRKLPVDIAFAEVDPSEYVGARHPRRPRARVHPPRRRRAPDHGVLLRAGPAGRHDLPRPAGPGGLRAAARAARPRPSRRCGATWRTPARPSSTRPTCVDGNMVSCRGWPDMPEWSRAFMNVLERAAVPA